jgi:excisionase family DNA binding protein
MGFPEQELFTIEDVAARWKQSVSYVQDLSRRGLLPMNRTMTRPIRDEHGKLIPSSLWGKRYVVREDLEAFERQHGISPVCFLSIKEYAGKYGISERTVFRQLKDGTLKGHRIGKHWRILD